MNLYTIGFAQKSAEQFFNILKKNNIIRVIDIRLNNKSQLAGFTNIRDFPYFLKIHNINYIHKPEFAPSKELLTGYKNKAISWDEYKKAYNNILIERNITEKIDWNILNNSVLLCSEPTPDNCHRRLLAEYLAEKNNKIKIKHL
ncbi:MAG: DUF488 domain-containing protein [Deltaproteobacteria bacterium]|nr:DUF488 domain-containing protein [Deltaproteobacteria bacterium]